MAREACGSEDHPDALMFIQIFRLLCAYSLVKPPRGGNVTGGELLEPLMKISENTTQESKQYCFNKIDELMERSVFTEDSFEEEQENSFSDNDFENSGENFNEHNYDVVKTSKEVVAFMAGYVAFKMIRRSS